MKTASIRSVLFLLTAMALGSWGWASDSEIRARLESEAPKAWSQVAALADHLDIQVRVTWSASQGDTEFLNEFKFAGKNRLLSSTTSKIPAGEKTERLGEAKVLAENSKYDFHIQKYDETRPWLLTHVGEPTKSFLEQIDEGAYSYAHFQLSVGDLYLPDVFGKPTFKIVGVELRDQLPDKLVAITFENLDPTRKVWSRRVKRGTILLNPERYWAIQEYQVEVERDGDDIQYWKQRTDFQDVPDKLPMVRKGRLTFGPNAEKVNWSISWDFDKYLQRDIPEEEFMLSAYGLPEVGPPSTANASKLWLILTAAGIVCVGIAIIWRWLGRRQAVRMIPH